MAPERWQIVKKLFQSVLDAAPEDRSAILDEIEPSLREEVLSLLTHHEHATDFLDKPGISASALLNATVEQNAFEPGELLLDDRFEIVQFVGSGGMGEVYKTIDHALRETVAIKTIRPELAADARVLERFRREIQHSRQVTHPSVCRIHDFFKATNRRGREVTFLTMEFLDGITLRDRILEHGTLSPKEALAIVDHLCAGLTAAHSAGVLHRDLKTANVMLVESQNATRVCITDFGLAQQLDAAVARQTALSGGAVQGTLPYLAPELLEGKPASVASDIYALGVMLFEMVTGHYPFESKDALVSITMRLRTPPMRPTTYTPGLPRRWERTILWCLASYPEKRPRNPAQVRQLLHGGIDSATASIPVLTAHVVNRRTVLATTIAAAAAVVLVWLARRGMPTPPPAARATMLVEDATGLPPGSPLLRVVRNFMRLSLSQSPRLQLLADATAETAARKVGALGPLAGAAALNAGRSLHAALSVATTVTQNGSAYQLNARLIDIETGRTLYTVDDGASLHNLTEAIDRIGPKLRLAIGEDQESIRTHSRPLDQPDSLIAEALDSFTKGLAAYNEGDIQGALGLLENATRLDPQFAMALIYQSIVNSALRRDEEAFPPAVRAFALHDKVNLRARNQIDWIYYAATGDLERALDKKRALAAMFPSESQLQRSVAHSYSLAQKFDDALRHGRLSIQLDPDNASNRMLVAGVLAQANRPGDALAEINEARRRLSDRPILYSGEGFALLVKGDTNAALSAFEKLGSLPDLQSVATQYRITALLLAGRLSEAKEQLEAGLQLALARTIHAEEDLWRYWLGQLAVLEENFAAARLHAAALSLRPDMPPSLFALRFAAEIAAEASAPDTLRVVVKKLDSIQRRYKSTRSVGLFHQASGLLAAATGDRTSGGELLTQAHSVWPDISSAWTLASHLHATGAFSQASRLFEEILAAKGTAVRFNAVIIWIASLAMSARTFSVLHDCPNTLNRLNQLHSHWSANTGLKLVTQSDAECSNCTKP